MEPVYRPVIGIALGIFKLLSWDVRLNGTEHIPTEGPAVIATNHVGYLDFIFVGAAARPSKRLVRFLAKQEVFDHRISGPLMRGMKHIPVDRFGRAKDSVDTSVAALDRGEIVGMFPESTINPSFVPGSGRSGAARMAMAAGAPLLPGAVWGSQRIMTKGRPRNFQRKVAISVDIGAPLTYDPSEDPADVTGRLMQEIGGMVKNAVDAYPQRPAGDDDRWWLPAHLGGTAPTPEEAATRLAAEREARRKRHEG